jgi:hypothetical protein
MLVVAALGVEVRSVALHCVRYIQHPPQIRVGQRGRNRQSYQPRHPSQVQAVALSQIELKLWLPSHRLTQGVACTLSQEPLAVRLLHFHHLSQGWELASSQEALAVRPLSPRRPSQ